MNKDLTELVFILDRSGSMAGLEDDTVGGFNAMVEKQKKEPGEALLSAVLFSKILNDPEYRPTKSTAIQLAIGLQLDLNQTRKLLETAGYALTRSSKADLVVQYYIERKIYSVTFINEALSDCGLPLLKTGLKS